MKILITGGHITPALAVIEELKKEHIDIVVVGRKYNGHRANGLSFEYQAIKNAAVPFIHLEAGRLSRLLNAKSLINFFKFLPGLFHSLIILNREKPNAVLSFGGYIALPVALAAYVYRIPVFTHEQTLIPGLTTRIVAHFAKEVFISFPETAKYFKKGVVTGNPLRKDLFENEKPFILDVKKPLIYITGGSLGSHSLNVHIEHILLDLLKDYAIVHQTGEAGFGDYERLVQKPIQSGEYYKAMKHVQSSELGSIYKQADLVVSRSGANTIFELIALKKPAVLVPLPWSASGEQEAHAKLLVSKGVAELFHQDQKSEELLHLIHKVMKGRDEYKRNYEHLATYFHKDSARLMVMSILHYLKV